MSIRIIEDKLYQRIKDKKELQIELTRISPVRDYFKNRANEIYKDFIDTYKYLTNTIDELYETYLYEIPETLYQQIFYFIRYTVHKECDKFEKVYRAFIATEEHIIPN